MRIAYDECMACVRFLSCQNYSSHDDLLDAGLGLRTLTIGCRQPIVSKLVRSMQDKFATFPIDKESIVAIVMLVNAEYVVLAFQQEAPGWTR